MANHQDNLSVYGSPKNGSAALMAVWQDGVRVSAVPSRTNQHTIHAYFNISPESPDGRWVLYFASVTSEGHVGDLHIVERATGQVRILARNVTVEDAHRAPASSGVRVDDGRCFTTAETGNGW